MKQLKRTFTVLLISSLAGVVFSGQSYACTNAQQSCSTNFGVSRTSFDSGGAVDTTCSTSYCAAQTLGDTTIGNSASTNYQVQAGYNVSRQPSLQFMVNTASVNVGVLSTTATTTATATFSVESYLSSGYAVETISPPPQNGSYTMAAPSTPTASQVGTEQFGINLVGNCISGGVVATSCSSPNFGSNPVQVPNSSFSYGVAAHNSSSDYYNTTGYFMYKNGDTIATSNKSSGQTDYTISYIYNISNLTPAGTFIMNQQLVAVPTF